MKKSVDEEIQEAMNAAQGMMAVPLVIVAVIILVIALKMRGTQGDPALAMPTAAKTEVKIESKEL